MLLLVGIKLLCKERWLNFILINILWGSKYCYIKNCRYVMILKDIFYIYMCLNFCFVLYFGFINFFGDLYKNVNINFIRMLVYYINYIILYLNIIYSLKEKKL